MTAHKPAQIVRYTAIVLAGTASLTLTVAAGAYIVNQIPDTKQTRQPQAAPTPATPEVITGGPIIADAALAGATIDLPASFRLPTTPAALRTELTPELPTMAPQLPTGLFAGRLRLGPTYVGAHLGPARTDAVAFTLDTNALTMLSGFLRTDTGDRPGVTQLRTEVDTRTGEILVTFADPGLGEHGLRLDRHPAPATSDTSPETAVAAPEYRAAPQHGSAAPKYAAVTPEYVATTPEYPTTTTPYTATTPNYTVAMPNFPSTTPNYTVPQEDSPSTSEPTDLVAESADPTATAPTTGTFII